MAKRAIIAIDESDYWPHETLSTALVELASNLALLIVRVDHADLIDLVLSELTAMMGGGLVTVEPVTVAHFQARGEGE